MACRCKAIKKLKNIALGYRRLAAGFTTEWTRKRKAKCDKCDERTPNWWCKECWCYIPAKVLVEDEECKLGFWNKVTE